MAMMEERKNINSNTIQNLILENTPVIPFTKTDAFNLESELSKSGFMFISSVFNLKLVLV